MSRDHLTNRHSQNVQGEAERLQRRLAREARIKEVRHRLRSATGSDRADYREELEALYAEGDE